MRQSILSETLYLISLMLWFSTVYDLVAKALFRFKGAIDEQSKTSASTELTHITWQADPYPVSSPWLHNNPSTHHKRSVLFF